MDSKVKYGQELGINLIKLSKKLLENQNLLKLLVNSDLDPLNPNTHPKPINGIDDVFGKNIRVIPLLTAEEQTTQSKIVLFYEEGLVQNNSDNENLSFQVNVYCPFEEWLIAGDTLRPFAIMSEIRKSLQDKRINGLGEIKYLGFNLSTLTDQMGSYIMRFSINAFS